jgi:hypothetical protein
MQGVLSELQHLDSVITTLQTEVASLQSQLASVMSGGAANLTSPQQGAGMAPLPDPAQSGAPTPTVMNGQTVGGALKPPLH